jgi:DNA-binding ferritin-like protein
MTREEARSTAEGLKGLAQDSESIDILRWLLALLRAQYWMYQQAHWESKGPPYYGNHLLFQRLYESVVDQVDTLAEKMVGGFGIEAVGSTDLGMKFLVWINRWQQTDCLHKRGVLSEQDFQKCCEDAYNTLKLTGEMTLGMDDFLMATANEHETNQYLLRQVLRTGSVQDEWAKLTGG